MWDFLRRILSQQNQFAAGGLAVMIVGGLGVLLRALPEKLWEWCVSQTTMTITVTDADAAFGWVKAWFIQQKFLTRMRRVDLDTTVRHNQLEFMPAPGWHWFWHARRPFRVHFHRSEDPKRWSEKRAEEFMFQTFGRNPSVLRAFVSEIVACHRANANAVSRLYVYDDYWEEVKGYAPRLLESVVFHPGEKEELLRDIENFKSSKARYRELGVPYHRGYLFYGPPGTGKTSLVSALAARFRLSVYLLNLTEFTDKSLVNAMREVPAGSVILFEDIDCVRTAHTRANHAAIGSRLPEKNSEKPSATEAMGVTLSGLLNALDGFQAPEDVLFVMTTNKIEELDDALLRPGRIDYRLYLGHASLEQKIELYRRFFPSAPNGDVERFIEANRGPQTMAEFQGLLLQIEQDAGSTEFEDLCASAAGYCCQPPPRAL